MTHLKNMHLRIAFKDCHSSVGSSTLFTHPHTYLVAPPGSNPGRSKTFWNPIKRNNTTSSPNPIL